MSDETSEPWGEPAEPAEPAGPAEPAEPAKPEERAAEDAPRDEPALAPAPVIAETPPPAPLPPPPPAPSAMPAQPAFQQPASPYGAPAPQPQSPYGGGYAPQPSYAAAPALAAPGGGKALASLVCGVCAIVFSGTVVVGIVLGVVAIVLASQYVRSFGKDGKATGGKVCGIVGIALSVLALVFYLVVGAATLVAIYDYDDVAPYYPARPEEVPALPEAAEEAAVRVAAEEVLEGIAAPDEALLARVAERADRSFEKTTDYTLSEVGVEPVEFARWLVDGMTYTMGDDDVFGYADGTGTAFAEARSRTLYNLTDALYDELIAYAEKKGSFANDAERQAAMAKFMPVAMEKAAGAAEESFIMLEFERTGDVWTVDDDSLEETLDLMFGLW
ncbi:hypothetical protein [Arabiibacter massiliensis]|uniref:hypothetical protein n=1 Tax=Arabiibacter massiliensis TaxID=1870985 RepID=UPI0009BB9C95|nr:hypothetical protein [Arabiibacter massiliensis]